MNKEETKERRYPGSLTPVTSPLYETRCPKCGADLQWRLHPVQEITCKRCGETFTAKTA